MEFSWFILITLAAYLHVGTCGACKDKSCPPNEEYVPCIQGVCRAMNCTQKGEDIPCPDRVRPKEQCDPGCICKEKHLRTAEGHCVPEDQCDAKVCPPNEQYSECIQIVCRTLNCSSRGMPVACPGINKKDCKKGCVCKLGFLRLANGTCVPEDKCGVPKCGKHEILDKCPTYSSRDYCPRSEYDNEYHPAPERCPPPACKCGFNRRRDDNDKCILTKDCPPFDCSYRPNEVYSPCPPICPTDSCGQERLTGKCKFRIGVTLECNPKCQCADGYGRYNGTCIPLGQCPDLCPINEEYNNCTQAVCRAQNCTQLNKPVACPAIAEGYCIRGCVCKENYYRNENGTCVPECQCKAPKCPNPNEEYRLSDIPNCPRRGLCESIVSRFACNEPQVAACVCKDGYLRLNETSPCIPASQCPQMMNSDKCEPTIVAS